MDLVKIEKAQKALYNKNLFDAFAKDLNVKSVNILTLQNSNYKIFIDEYSIEVYIDKYNNLDCYFKKGYIIPVEYLPKFARILSEYLENKDSYRKRTTDAFYIEYFEQYYDIISLSEVREMLKVKGEDNQKNFYNFLLTDKYMNNGFFGDIENDVKYTRKDLSK